MSHVMCIGTRKGLWVARSDDRLTWELEGPHFPAFEVAAVACDTRGGAVRILASLRSEWWGVGLVSSSNAGGTWSEPDNTAISFSEDTGAALARVWQLTPDSASRPGVWWAGCEPTSLWRSGDDGRSFDLVRGLWDHPHRSNWRPGYGGAAIHTILPDADSERVIVAMSTGGVYVSEANAENWQPRNKGIEVSFAPDPYPEYGQCVHKVVSDASGQQTLYAQNHGGVYRSDDTGSSWSSIGSGLSSDFGFVMLADPVISGTAWVVPIDGESGRVPPNGKLRVHRTRDAGCTWEALGAGLPDASWSSTLRDAACVDTAARVDVAAETGVYLGTRDGWVYASADGGDNFVTVAGHLSDVLSVRVATTPE